MLKSLKSKYILIGIVLLFSQIAVILIGQNSIAIIDKIGNLDKNVRVIQSFMESDMMHDAMRGDVISAMLAQKNGNVAGIEDAKKEFDEHYHNFKKQLENIISYGVNKDITDQISINSKLIDDYASTGNVIFNAISAGQNVENQYADFDKAFKVLEVKNSETSDAIQKWTISEKSSLINEAHNNKDKLLLISALGFLIVICVVLYPVFFVFRPLDIISRLMKEVADGNHTMSIPFMKRDDEVGLLAKSLSVFKQNAHDKIELEERQKLLDKKAVEDRKQSMLSLANNFENSVKHIVDAVASASTEMHSTSSGVANIAQDSSSQISKLVDVLTSTSGNVQTVASATTELSASIQEISRQMSRSATITTQAVSEAAKAEQTVQQLSAAAAKIGEVVSLISDIASQINLLALNATIESARAGEAGKALRSLHRKSKTLPVKPQKQRMKLRLISNPFRNRPRKRLRSLVRLAAPFVKSTSSPLPSQVP